MPQPGAQPEVIIETRDVLELFHQVYYTAGRTKTGTWSNTFWMGTRTEKCPLDLWVYQEIIHSIKPQLIVETGTRHGGSALYLSHLCDLLGQGEVVTIDIVHPPHGPEHPRLTYLTGSSTDPGIVAEVRRRAEGKKPILIILDSDHKYGHVIDELRIYHPLVTRGSYLIVEDTNVNGHPVWPEHGPGPMEALEHFMKENRDFVVDHRCEKFLLTFNPKGFLRRND